MKREIHHRTERRTPAEKQLAEELLARAVKSKPDPAKFARAARASKAAQKSPRFEYNRDFSVIDQLPIKRFYQPKEFVVGIIGEPGQEMWMGSTYPLVLDDGRVIRLPGNRMLHKRIQEADAVGKHVKITYDGKLFYRYGGHYQKAYTIEEIPLDASMTEKGRKLLTKIHAEAGVEVAKKRDDQPAALFKKTNPPAKPKEEQPIALNKTKARQILEDAAAQGDTRAAQMLEQIRKRETRRPSR